MKSLVILALVAVPLGAHAQVNCTLREVEGTRAPGGIGPGLDDIRAMLSQAPFAEYKSFRLIGSHELHLKKDVPEKVVFSHKHRYEVTYLERLAQREGRARLRLRLEVYTPQGKKELSTIVVLDENGTPLPRVEQQADHIVLALLGCRS